MAASLTWYKDNSMLLTATVTSSGTGATVTGTLLNAAGTTVWTGSLSASGTADTYTATINPADASVTVGQRYTLDIDATYSGKSLSYPAIPVEVENRSP